MKKTIQIGSTSIGENHKPFIIAEMSGNHNQSLERALAIVDAAAEAGADALKLQTYTADTMTVKGVCTIRDEGSLWKGQELYELYQQAYTPWEWHRPLFKRAKQHGMIAFSSPFDATGVDFLEKLEVPAYKVASFENTDHPLLRKIAQTGKPCRFGRVGAGFARKRLPRFDIAEMHEHLSGFAHDFKLKNHPPSA